MDWLNNNVWLFWIGVGLVLAAIEGTDAGRVHNTSLLIAPDGEVAGVYRKLHMFDVEVGDEIIYSKYGGTEVKVGMDEYLILRESDVLAKVVRGFARDDLFCVVHDVFQTDTADYADIVLPATTQLEHLDVHGTYGQWLGAKVAKVFPDLARDVSPRT